MNRQAFWIVPALALALAAPAAAKNDKNKREKEWNKARREAASRVHEDDWYGGRYRGSRAENSRFRGFDRNGDGVITRKEWPGNDKSFNQHDLNRDGVLAGREVRAGSRRDVRRDVRMARRGGAFASLDRNRDGVLQEYEWPYGSDDFYRLDRNGNRIIESWEYRR